MEISSYKEENYNIVEVHGDLDASSAVELDNEIKAIFEKNETNIFIDCKDLNYIASAGLGVFMSYIQEIEAGIWKVRKTIETDITEERLIHEF